MTDIYIAQTHWNLYYNEIKVNSYDTQGQLPTSRAHSKHLTAFSYEILNFTTDFVPVLCSCQTCTFFSSYKSGKKHETTEFLNETICT